MKKKAVVLFSGGIDSTTTLYWAKTQFEQIIALTIDYSQRHRLEVKMARRIASKIKCDFQFFRIPLKNFLSSALLDDFSIIPSSLNDAKKYIHVTPTYVPFRNGIFLSLAAAFAESHGISDLVTGFNRIDSPDYPDTSETFTKKMQNAINAGTTSLVTGKKFVIHIPLINLNKAEIIKMGFRFRADYSYSLSCYRGKEIPCQKCSSCEIRSHAFKELCLEDPLISRLRKEGKL